ncbi:MAG: tetratricopeptide repeat protein, partial [Litorivicinaceae bacterium]
EAVATSSTPTSTPATADSTTGGVGEAGAQASVSNDISDQDAYNSAFQLIRERKFDEALVAMDSFIRAYPDSELVLDARFWRGQVFDVLGRDEEAIEAFKSLTLVAPDYRRILQVKVKLGKLLIKNQDVMNGRKILQEVITQAPESVEAGLASRELEKTN